MISMGSLNHNLQGVSNPSSRDMLSSCGDVPRCIPTHEMSVTPSTASSFSSRVCIMDQSTSSISLEESVPCLALCGQLQLAMCAVHLGTGHTAHCKQIKAASVEQH